MPPLVLDSAPPTPELPLAPRPPGQLTVVAAPIYGLERRVDVGQVIGERVRVAGAIGAVDRDDLRGGQVHARVELGDLRVVPARDLAGEHVGEHRAGELEVVRHALDVVGDAGRGQRPRDLQAALAGGRLRRRQRRVGGAEVHRAAGDLRDPAARADRAVGDRHAVGGVVGRRPLLQQRRDERRAGADQRGRAADRRTSAAAAAAAAAGRTLGGHRLGRASNRTPPPQGPRALRSVLPSVVCALVVVLLAHVR